MGGGRPGPGSRQGTVSTPQDQSLTEEEKKERAPNKFDAKAAQVRAQTSFAAAAGGTKKEDPAVNETAEKLAGVTV